MPSKWSGARYVVATGSLIVFFLASLFTFVSLNNSYNPQAPQLFTLASYTEPVQYTYPIALTQQPKGDYAITLWRAFSSKLQNYLPLIVLFWATGMFLFTIRLLGGWLTVVRLRSSAIPVEDLWNDRLQNLALQIKINQVVRLAESAIVKAPVVIGYFKPIILIPLGMLGGLSTQQLESIIIHELVHIRRRDYVVNLLQSLLETIFFFNPFVWIISNIIRREREHCCDDAVIAIHGNPLVYAHALAALEEARLSRAGLALSFAENKNQLLNRIKRIMEKSVKPYSLRDRMVPLVLLVTGLICASWITITSGKFEPQQDNQSISDKESAIAADTTIKIERSGRYYRKSVTTIGEDGKPHEEVVEEFDGDGDFAPPIPPIDFELTVPALDPVTALDAMSPLDMLTAMPAVPPYPAFNFDLNINTDTIPFPMGPGFHESHAREWAEFAEEFESSFREKFGDFYEKNEVEIERMMKDLEARFDGHSFENMAEQMQMIQLDQLHNQELLALQEEQMKDFGEQMEQWAEENAKAFAELDRNLNMLEVPHFEFPKEFREELVKDGYLKDDEEIKSIEINNEIIKVNGKKIKEADQSKYNDILKKNSLGSMKQLRRVPPSPGRRE
jgi:beta-lactamase regulating signal transducer with metallopeptidase domain